MGIIPEEPEKEQMYVASVPDKTHGASVIAYQDFMDKAAERLGGDFFILPSSVVTTTSMSSFNHSFK